MSDLDSKQRDVAFQQQHQPALMQEMVAWLSRIFLFQVPMTPPNIDRLMAWLVAANPNVEWSPTSTTVMTVRLILNEAALASNVAWRDQFAAPLVALLLPFSHEFYSIHDYQWNSMMHNLMRSKPCLALELLRHPTFQHPSMRSSHTTCFLSIECEFEVARRSMHREFDGARRSMQLQLFSTLCGHLSTETLNVSTDHPLIYLANRVIFYAVELEWANQVWRTALDNWMTPCGTRMRFHGAVVVFPPGKRGVALQHALESIVPPPHDSWTAMGKENRMQHRDILIGGIQRKEAQFRDQTRQLYAILNTCCLGGLEHLSPLLRVVASCLVLEQYL